MSSKVAPIESECRLSFPLIIRLILQSHRKAKYYRQNKKLSYCLETARRESLPKMLKFNVSHNLYWCPENFREFLTTLTTTFPQKISWAFVSIKSVNVRTKFEVRSFVRSWDNRGSQKLRSLWLCPRSLFPQNPIGLPYRLLLYVHSFSRNFRLYWLGIANLQSIGEGAYRVGKGNGTVRKSVAEFL